MADETAIQRLVRLAGGPLGLTSLPQGPPGTNSFLVGGSGLDLSQTVLASSVGRLLGLTDSFSVDAVRQAFQAQMEADRRATQAANRAADAPYEPAPYHYVKEMWTDFLIVESESKGAGQFQIPYTVNDKGEPTFGTWSKVRTEYVAAANSGSIQLWLATDKQIAQQLDHARQLSEVKVDDGSVSS